MIKPHIRLVIWDTYTGVVIKEFEIQGSKVIAFHGDQRKITSVTHTLDFYTYDVLNGIQLCQGQLSPGDSELGACWAHNDTLQFATTLKTDGELVINIHELQPTLTSPLHLLSSFTIPPQSWGFSFSPVSFHASFVTKVEVTILDIQSSKTLLRTKVAQEYYRLGLYTTGQFSYNGCFFACGVSWGEIHIWQNTPTGYVSWSILRPQLSHHTSLWSPTSISILCLGSAGTQLLHPDNCLSPMSPKPNQGQNHLVAYSADQRYIAITQKDGSVITILDHLLDPLQQPINTGMQIQDIKIIDNTIFVVDKYRLSSWDLKPSRTPNGAHNAVGVGFNKPLRIGFKCLLSHNCSEIIFTVQKKILLYNIQASEVTSKIHIESCIMIADLQLSPKQFGLWYIGKDRIFGNFKTPNKLVKLEIGGEGFGNVTSEDVWDTLSWVNILSPHGYHIGERSKWVTDPRGSKLLWLPPNWRVNDWSDARWNNNFLALVAPHHPDPIIIEFQS